jgi:hypothetical protein
LEASHFLLLKLYYKGTVIKTEQHCHKNSHTDQRNRMGSTEMNPNMNGQLLTKPSKKQNGKSKSLFNSHLWKEYL